MSAASSATVTFADVVSAASLISSHVHRTPALTCASLSALASRAAGVPVELVLKCELFQKTGSFKFRGATNAVRSLSPRAAARGVVTHSSGNHAAALALAASARGVPAFIVMPSDAPALKVTATRGYGATVETCAPGAAARSAAAAVIADRTGAAFVHPSEDARVIAGQGTLALELFEQAADAFGAPAADGAPPLDYLVVPVGGGGLISGCALAARGVDARIRVLGAEPSGVGGGSADASRSFRGGALSTHADGPPLETAADGLRTSLGERTWPLIRDNVDDVLPVSEAQIGAALRAVYERAKLAIETSAAVGIAAVLGADFAEDVRRAGCSAMGRPLRVGVVLCGGNADIDDIAKIMGARNA